MCTDVFAQAFHNLLSQVLNLSTTKLDESNNASSNSVQSYTIDPAMRDVLTTLDNAMRPSCTGRKLS